MRASLQINVWSVLVYVVAATLIAIGAHDGMAPSALLLAAGAFG